MPRSHTGECVTEVLDFPLRDGLAVRAVRVDDDPGGFTALRPGQGESATVYDRG